MRVASLHRHREIVIEEGEWIASNATILGACRIGRYAVVAAGSVVTHDVAPYTGRPACPSAPSEPSLPRRQRT